MDDLRVLIVAADPLARAGLATLLAAEPGCTVAGQVGVDADLQQAVVLERASVVVVDLGWDPGASLRANLERIGGLAAAGVPVLVLLADSTHAGNVWEAGVRGLLLRNAGPARIGAALSAVSHGLVVLDPPLWEHVEPGHERPSQPLPEPLTLREIEVLGLLADGLTNKAIARRLQISENTVKFHVNAILDKLSAQSRTEAVVRASRQGLIEL